MLCIAAGLWLWRTAPLPVQVTAVRRGPLVVVWTADADCSGTVVQVASELPGVVERIFVREGSTVRRGQLIAEVGAEEARAELRRAEAELRRLEQQVPADVAAARSRLDAARAQLRKLQRGSRAEEIAAAEAQLKRATGTVSAAEARVAELEEAVNQQRRAAEAAIAQARAQLAAAEAELKQALAGPRHEDIAAAQADLAGAEAVLEKARKDLQRIRRLYDQQAAPASAVDQAEETYRLAQARVEAAKQNLDKLRRGTREEVIAAARARRDAAQAGVREAEAQAEHVAQLEQQLQAARAALAQARAAHEEAEANAQLVRRGPRQEDIDAAQSEVRQAQAMLEAAKASRAAIAAARAAVEQARARLAKSRIRAPADGEVSRKLVDAGDYVAPGQPLVEIVVPGRVWVTALVDDQDIGKVRVGQKVRVLSEAYPGRVFPGTVAVISGAAHPKAFGRARAKVVPVRVEVEDKQGLLRPGMELDVEGRTVLRKSTLIVPTDALLQQDGQWFVWVVSEGRATKRRVDVGAESVEQTEVKSGLREGELVILGEKEGLREGQRVRPAQSHQPRPWVDAG